MPTLPGWDTQTWVTHVWPDVCSLESRVYGKFFKWLCLLILFVVVCCVLVLACSKQVNSEMAENYHGQRRMSMASLPDQHSSAGSELQDRPNWQFFQHRIKAHVPYLDVNFEQRLSLRMQTDICFFARASTETKGPVAAMRIAETTVLVPQQLYQHSNYFDTPPPLPILEQPALFVSSQV